MKKPTDTKKPAKKTATAPATNRITAEIRPHLAHFYLEKPEGTRECVVSIGNGPDGSQFAATVAEMLAIFRADPENEVTEKRLDANGKELA